MSYCIDCLYTGELRNAAPNCTCKNGYEENDKHECILTASGCPI